MALMRFGEWYSDGGWHVRHHKTTRPFRQLREQAIRGLGQGLTGMMTAHEWKGQELRIHSPGVESLVTFEAGVLTCKVKIAFPVSYSSLATEKILSESRNLCEMVAGSPASGEKEVFIVHGHNDAARTQLRKILSALGLNPVVLVEENDLGLTIIEKFEYYARNCSFAFILMTPDDEAPSVGQKESQWRARQNVIMELGWFMAYLGRDRVAILHQGELEIPSDILGVITMRFEHTVGEVADKIAARVRYAGLVSAGG